VPGATWDNSDGGVSEKLATAAPPRWRFCRSFSLAYARTHAERGNLVGATGQTAKAVMEKAHAIICQRGE
jgi:hypothetical protein